VQRPR